MKLVVTIKRFTLIMVASYFATTNQFIVKLLISTNLLATNWSTIINLLVFEHLTVMGLTSKSLAVDLANQGGP